MMVMYLHACMHILEVKVYSPYVYSRSLPMTLRYEPCSLSNFANTLIELLSANIFPSTALRNMLTLSPEGIDGEQMMVE